MITAFIFHVAQFITFHQTKNFTATLIAKASLKAFYSRLGFKVIKDFETSPNLKEARKRFHCESGKSRELQKQTIGSRRVKILHDNRIDLN